MRQKTGYGQLTAGKGNSAVLLGWIHALLSLTCNAGDLSLNRTFSDNMVLQRNRPIPVFGTARAGTEVTVRLDDRTARVTCGPDGAWRVELPAMPAGGPYVLRISADGVEREFTNVLVGDVWVCAGQSNMNWPLRNQPEAEAELAGADRPEIRFFRSPTNGNTSPQDDFGEDHTGWEITSPETAGGFSGLAYHFATQIQADVKVPIGIIHAARGGSFIESWIPRAAVEATPELHPILEQWEWLNANRDRLRAEQRAKRNAWDREHGERFREWRTGRESGPFIPTQPSLPPYAGTRHDVSGLYNESIHPHTARPVKGVVWYQGESNTDRGYQYRLLLPVLVQSWREVWGQPELPFVVIQLPNYDPHLNTFGPQDGGPWEIVRESQAMILEVPNTALAVTLGMGLDHSVHPPDKRGPATRAAQSALKLAYGREIPASAPRYVEHLIEGNAIYLTFSDVGEGLVSLREGEITGFEIAGDDKVFHPARAGIVDAATVRVFSEEVSSPQAVRHAWSGTPDFDLANSAGIPASTFRTDDWEVPTQDKTMPFEWLRSE
ncbi:MAG: hypothetical protein JJU05_02865 [Verrucomicrobia bacterium]|nr:hypothetical protein [Verrucomicrobiota bacterium]MCH8527686.1 hypothetical protein [Kiritimatiellia bacterium]